MQSPYGLALQTFVQPFLFDRSFSTVFATSVESDLTKIVYTNRGSRLSCSSLCLCRRDSWIHSNQTPSELLQLSAPNGSHAAGGELDGRVGADTQGTDSEYSE